VNKNNAAGLEKTVQSVVVQTFTDFEYIIIDGGSDDGSVDVIKKYTDKITYWVSEPDAGIYNGMNKGIRAAHGEFCLFLNSGDWLIESATLQNVFEEIAGLPEDMGEGGIYYSAWKSMNNVSHSMPDTVDINYLIGNPINHQNMLIRLSLFLNHEFYNEQLQIVSDTEFLLKEAWIYKTKFVCIKTSIALFDITGISTIKPDIREYEKRIVFRNVFHEMAESIIELYNYRQSVYATIIGKYGNTKLLDFLLYIYSCYRRISIKIKSYILENIVKPIPFFDRQFNLYKGVVVSTKLMDKEIKRFFNDILVSKKKFLDKLEAKNLIVSFTSFPARMPFIEYTLFSLVQQSIRPAKIVLWLSEEEFGNKKNSIPENIKKYFEFNFEIQFVKENYRSYNKLVFALGLYSDSLIVTVDDDIYYKNDWLEMLYHTHSRFPKDIIAHRVHNISFKDKYIDVYRNWNGKERELSYLNFLTGVGGVLYPPGCLYFDVCKYDIFLNLCPYADDVWFYVMAILQKTKIRVVRGGYKKLMVFDYIFKKASRRIPTLMQINVDNNQNDIQLKAVLEYYGVFDSFYTLYNDGE
jgi:glycosyltransferase involved in cell wall biosynthesis